MLRVRRGLPVVTPPVNLGLPRQGAGRPAPCTGCRLQTVTHRGDQFPVGGVAAELPEEGAAEAVRPGVAHLPGDRVRGVVAPPLTAAESIRRARHGGRCRAAGLDHLVVLDALLVRAGRGAGRAAAWRGLADTWATSTVEADADEEFVRRDALAAQLAQGRVGVEPGLALRVARYCVERGVRGCRALRRPGAEEVVRHHVVPVDVLR